MKKYVFLFLFLQITVSCTSQKYVSSQSTIKLEGHNTNIREVLDIDGYYKNYNFGCSNAMFFADGTYVRYFYFKEGATEEQIRTNMVEWIKWPEKMGRMWGVYRIEDNVLIGQGYDKGFFYGISMFEERYTIVDRTTLKQIYWKRKNKEDEKFPDYDPWLNYDFSYHFIPADSLPNSDCWLKEKKWIWRNEQDWKDYMERIKQKKY